MYVGFSAGSFLTYQYVLGWSFAINSESDPLDFSQLPKLPRVGPKKHSKFLAIGIPLICTILLVIVVFGLAYHIRRQLKFSELVEDWEVQYGPHRYRYKDLYIATKGFKDRELLGKGGFGKVYRGVLANSRHEIAVKKVSHESRQGIKEFVAEIVSMGRLRHRNLVPLLGYCRRKRELLLVYEYMPNGSLDKFIHDNPKYTLNWNQRFRPVETQDSSESAVLSDWVYSLRSQGQIMEAVDHKLGANCVKEEVQLVLELGLSCLHSRPEMRPSMRHVMMYLTGAAALPELSSFNMSAADMVYDYSEGFDAIRSTLTTQGTFSGALLVSSSTLRSGR